MWCVCEVLRDWPLAVRVFPVFVRVHQLSSNLSLMSSWVVLVCVLSNLNKNGQGLKEVIKLKGWCGGNRRPMQKAYSIIFAAKQWCRKFHFKCNHIVEFRSKDMEL